VNNDIVGGFDDEEMEGLAIRLADVPTVDGCLVIQCSGWFSVHSSGQFLNRVAKAIAAGFTRLVFDLHDVNYVEDIFFLVTILRSLRKMGGDLVLQGVQPRVYEVLQLLGFARFFTCTSTLEDSVSHLSRRPEDATFPRVFACPTCGGKVRAVRAGRFRCPRCRTIFALAVTGAVDFG
jgi:anti-sigma B factor antagonist